jgi:hypothetical protein
MVSGLFAEQSLINLDLDSSSQAPTFDVFFFSIDSVEAEGSSGGGISACAEEPKKKREDKIEKDMRTPNSIGILII